MKKAALFIAFSVLLTGIVFSGGAEEEQLEPNTFTDTVTTSQLGGENRMATYLSTDRDIYKPGDTLFIRCLVLDALTNAPFTAIDEASVSILAPRGDVVDSDTLYGDTGILSYSWTIPVDTAGGDYTVKLEFPDYAGGFPPVERTVRVMAYRAPRIIGDLVFFKNGYYPGEKVKVSGSFKRAEGGVPEGASVKVTARVDGEELPTINAVLGVDGLCEAEFVLPDWIEVGDGTVSFLVRDGGVRETVSKTIPILVNNYTIDFYPEGGDLIAGVPNRVYFQATFANGKPADISGRVKTADGKTLAEAETVHEGRGVFAITPALGDELFLEVKGSRDEVKSYPLPAAVSGFALSSDAPAYRGGQAVAVSVYGTERKTLTLTVSRREKQLAKQEIKVAPGQAAKTLLLLPGSAEGVLRLTLFEGKKPVAERLIYRAQDKPASVSVTVAGGTYAPGDTVELMVKTADAAGNPVAATVGLCVTDYSVQKLIEKRDASPDLPAMVFLEPEVEELYAADEYLAGSETANCNLDLLLGVQGWRRFAFYNWNEFYANFGDSAKRLAALNVIYIPPKLEEVDFMDFPLRNMVEERMPMKMFAMPAPVPAPMAMGIPEPPNFAMPVEEAAGGKIEDIAMEMEDDDAGADQGALAADMIGIPPGDEDFDSGFVAVREYAHQKKPNWMAGQRADFRETVYWNANVATDARTGSAAVKFDLNDSVATFQVQADAISAAGKIAASKSTFDSVKPFFAEAKMPVALAKTDRLQLPISLANNTKDQLKGEVAVYIDGVLIEKRPTELAAGVRSRMVFTIDGFATTGVKKLIVKADFGALSDLVAREFTVTPVGFPIVSQMGGSLRPNNKIEFNINIPETARDVRTKVLVYPSPAANLSQALTALIRQPYGCFEQTSSTSYPLVMAQQYFLKTPGIKPETIREAQKNLEDAFGRLTGFESPEKGFEWFGENPGHEALTAYGLMEFIEMGKVMDVDPVLVERTQDWLLSRRDGQGGYSRNSRALDSFGGAPADTTNAYITWALVNSSISGLDKEIAWLEKTAFTGDDSYIQALAAYVLYKIGETAKAETLMSHLAKKQKPDGSVGGAVASITRSGGNSLLMETTALSLLAWLYSDVYAGNVESAMRYVTANCQSGMFFSTQGTILALKAIILYDEKWSRPQRAGSIDILIGDAKVVGVDFTPADRGIIELPDLSPLLKPGANTVALKMNDGSAMPFTAEYSYYALVPANSAACRLNLTTKLRNASLSEGAATELTATITNRTKEAVPTPIAIIGIPGGMEVRYDYLKEQVKAGVIDSFEIRDQELVLYWRQLKAEAAVTVNISLTAVLPGRYTAPASRVYEYYTAEYKNWTEGVAATIQ